MSVIINGTSGISTDGGSELFGSGSIGGSLTLTSGTANGVTYLNGSKVLTSGSALTFDGSTFGVTGATTVTGDISTTSTGRLNLRGSGTGVNYDFQLDNDDSLAYFRASRSNAVTKGYAWFLNNSTSEGMRLTSTGLGIGTSSPAGKLHVVGAQNAWSQVIAGNTTSTQSYGMRIQAGTTSADTSLLIRDATNTADYLTVIGNGNVGIGTSLPSSKLSVSGAVRRYYVTGGNPQAEEGFTYSDATTAYAGMWFNNYFSSTLKTDILFKTSNDAGTVATVATLNGAGNLGLGVTPSAWSATGAGGPVLQIKRGMFFGSNSETRLIHNAYYDGSDFRYIATDPATNYQQSSGQHRFYTAASGTAGNAISFTQAMTLDASGNLGIGTTSLAGMKLVAKGANGYPATSGTTQTGVFRISGGTGVYNVLDMGVNESTDTAWMQATRANSLATYDKLVINPYGGNVGIGTTSISSRLHVVTTAPTITTMESTAANGGYLTFSNGSTVPLYIGFGSTLATGLSTSDAALRYSNNLVFSSGSAEKMRIDSSGNLLVGMTSFVSSIAGGAITYYGSFNSYTATGDYSIFNKTTSTTAKQIEFRSANSAVGDITCTSTTTAYNTSSDYRLKEDLVAVADASTRVNALKPVNFAWKADGSRVDGFLAHELAEVVPEAVTGEKDAVDAEGKPVYQGIDQSKLVPLLTAALQEALARIESLEADVATLKGTA